MSVMQIAKSTITMPVSIETAATVVLVISLAMGGCNGILASGVSLPSYQIVLIRAMLGALILGALLVVSRRPLAALAHKGEALMLAGAGAALGLDWLFLFEAYAYAGVGLSTILCYCAPVIVMVLSPVVFREKFTAAKSVGFSVVVAGAVLVNASAVQGGVSAYGVTCGLASAVCFAAMMMLSKKVSHVYGIEKVFIEIAAAALVVLVYAVFCKGITFDIVFAVRRTDVLPLALLGVSTALSNYLYLKAMGALSAQSVAVLGYVEPLSAVALGALVLGETLTPLQLVGAACIIAGAVVSELHVHSKSAKLA